jgi:hypothetical protein
MKLSVLLDKYLPDSIFWTSLECKPISRISGIFQKKRGVRSGLPDFVCSGWRATDFRRAEVTGRRRNEVAETGPCRIVAGRCYVVDGTKRARSNDGIASFGRSLPPPLEAAAAATVGGTVRGSDAATAAGAGRGRTATGGTTAMAGASAAPRG